MRQGRWSDRKDLFCGTTYEINEIDVTRGREYKDFGKGFYATAVKSHAESIARRNKRILEAREVRVRQRNPEDRANTFQAYRYNLEFDDRLFANELILTVSSSSYCFTVF